MRKGRNKNKGEVDLLQSRMEVVLQKVGEFQKLARQFFKMGKMLAKDSNPVVEHEHASMEFLLADVSI